MIGIVGSDMQNLLENNENENYHLNITVNENIDNNSSLLLNKFEDHFLTNYIFIYLTAFDLCQLSQCSHKLYLLATNPNLWNLLFRKDFVLVFDSNCISSYGSTSNIHTYSTNNMNNYLNLLSNESLSKSTKVYKEKYQIYRRSIESSKFTSSYWYKYNRIENRKDTISYLLDLTQFRILFPLPFLALSITILLFALRLDNYIHSSFWLCGLPLLIALVYLLFSLYLTLFIYKKQFDATSMFQSHWSQLRSPFIDLFSLDINYKRVVSYTTIVLTLLIIQVLLICAKLEYLYSYSGSKASIPWGAVFIPFWILFCFYLYIPMLKILYDYQGYVFNFIVLWIPLVILMICLTVKLTGMENNYPSDRIRLALIFIPFWILEGFVVITMFVFMLTGIQQYRSGLLDSPIQHIAAFALTLYIFLPLLFFQGLLSAKDDNNKVIPHIYVVIPILFLIISFYFLLSTVLCINKTPYEESLETRRDLRLGRMRLFKL